MRVNRLVVEEIHSTDAVWKQVQDADSDELPVDPVTLMIGTQFALLSIRAHNNLASQWRVAEESLEAMPRDFIRRFLVDNALIVLENVILLF